MPRQTVAAPLPGVLAQPIGGLSPGSISTQAIEQNHRSTAVPPVCFLPEPETVSPLMMSPALVGSATQRMLTENVEAMVAPVDASPWAADARQETVRQISHARWASASC